MSTFIARLRSRAPDRGATAVEYALIVAVLAMVIAGAGLALSGGLNNPLAEAVACLQDVADCSP
jgi:Flp pilus assembly pilin Flp